MPNLEKYEITLNQLNKAKQFFIVACGTVMYASLARKYIIEQLARVPVTVDISSEFPYREPLILKDNLVIIISQPEETTDSLAVMRLAKQLGITTHWGGHFS